MNHRVLKKNRVKKLQDTTIFSISLSSSVFLKICPIYFRTDIWQTSKCIDGDSTCLSDGSKFTLEEQLYLCICRTTLHKIFPNENLTIFLNVSIVSFHWEFFRHYSIPANLVYINGINVTHMHLLTFQNHIHRQITITQRSITTHHH